MRNVFDQYSQPENRLTHCLMTALHEDRLLLKDFLAKFCPVESPPISKLQISEQGLPGRVSMNEDEAERQGLPDGLIFDDEGWAFVIESKIMLALTKDQLSRHVRTIQRCGYNKITGLAITPYRHQVESSGWSMVTWGDIYKWAATHKASSEWACRMIEYFNIAEAKMAASEYLTEGTITTFSGIKLDPYSYLEAKRVLRLLMKNLREDRNFLEHARIDGSIPGRAAITNQSHIWDFLSPVASNKAIVSFTKSPHYTVSVNEEMLSTSVTLPNGMSNSDRFRIIGNDTDAFTLKLMKLIAAIEKYRLISQGGRPFIKLQQRRYASQRSIPVVDGLMEFDLRVLAGGRASVKQQPAWIDAVFSLLKSRQSNIQIQIGTQFYYTQCPAVATEKAEILAKNSFRALSALLQD